MLEFKNTVLSTIGNFLQSLHFCCEDDETLKEGIISIVDMIADYYEEGNHFYPEVLLIDDIEFLKLISCDYKTFYEGQLDAKEFAKAIKMAAPLAVNGWDIFICVPEKGKTMTWGLVTSNITVCNLSLYNQVVKSENTDYKVCLIRNLGKKAVALERRGETTSISFSLEQNTSIDEGCIEKFSEAIVSKCADDNKDKKQAVFEKMIDRAFKSGHGNLLAVMKNGKRSIKQVQNKLKQGILFMDAPIDISLLIDNYISADNSTKEGLSQQINNNVSLAISMMNHDGITLFSNDGKILGYHLIVENSVKGKEEIGGARTKAFKALCDMACMESVMIKKQEGDINIKDDGNK